ncbi:MAG: hypothetical protein ACKO47_05935 [Alphaproteobacteria bacterium]
MFKIPDSYGNIAKPLKLDPEEKINKIINNDAPQAKQQNEDDKILDLI